jgi:hypothetical protein
MSTRRAAEPPARHSDGERLGAAGLSSTAGYSHLMEVHGKDQTDLPPQWLPVECRGGAWK